MNELVHKELRIEYEKKRNRAFAAAEEKRRQIYENYPELQSIDDQIRRIGLSLSKAVLHKGYMAGGSIEEISQRLKTLKESKQAVLKNAGIALEDLEPKYECNMCNDSGFIGEKGQMCSCYKQKLINLAYKQSNLELLGTENFSTFREELYSQTQDFERYGTKISPRDNILKIKEKCMEFVKNFDKPETKNLLFTGEPGLGKTFLSNCIAKELLDSGKTVIYQTSPRLLDMIMDYKMRYDRNDDFNDDEYARLFEANLLIIDDLGTEALNPARLSEFFTIINTRLLTQKNKCTKTILSTNLSLEGINKFYDDRLMSRILGEFNIYKFFGDDLRIQKVRAV